MLEGRRGREKEGSEVGGWLRLRCISSALNSRLGGKEGRKEGAARDPGPPSSK